MSCFRVNIKFPLLKEKKILFKVYSLNLPTAFKFPQLDYILTRFYCGNIFSYANYTLILGGVKY